MEQNVSRSSSGLRLVYHDPPPETALRTATLPIEHKDFVFGLRENRLGRFLRITEEVHGRRNSIIIPESGFKEFAELLASLVKAAQEPQTVDRSQTKSPQ